MGTPKIMKLVNPRTGEMECKVCGAKHWASIKNGRYVRGSWQCPQGCKLPEKRNK